MTSASELVTKSVMVATARPQIQVHASFPHTMALGADLSVDPSNLCWVHCLTIPLETLNTLQFSQRATFRPVPTRSMLRTTMLASQLSPPKQARQELCSWVYIRLRRYPNYLMDSFSR